jgi:hypothetical protein
VVRRVSGCKREGVKGGRSQVHNEELHDCTRHEIGLLLQRLNGGD